MWSKEATSSHSGFIACEIVEKRGGIALADFEKEEFD